jgi:hypothetical protein
MKYTVEVGSRVMMYIPSLIKTDSGILKLVGARGFTDTRRVR